MNNIFRFFLILGFIVCMLSPASGAPPVKRDISGFETSVFYKGLADVPDTLKTKIADKNISLFPPLSDSSPAAGGVMFAVYFGTGREYSDLEKLFTEIRNEFRVNPSNEAYILVAREGYDSVLYHINQFTDVKVIFDKTKDNTWPGLSVISKDITIIKGTQKNYLGELEYLLSAAANPETVSKELNIMIYSHGDTDGLYLEGGGRIKTEELIPALEKTLKYKRANVLWFTGCHFFTMNNVVKLAESKIKANILIGSSDVNVGLTDGIRSFIKTYMPLQAKLKPKNAISSSWFYRFLAYALADSYNLLSIDMFNFRNTVLPAYNDLLRRVKDYSVNNDGACHKFYSFYLNILHKQEVMYNYNIGDVGNVLVDFSSVLKAIAEDKELKEEGTGIPNSANNLYAAIEKSVTNAFSVGRYPINLLGSTEPDDELGTRCPPTLR